MNFEGAIGEIDLVERLVELSREQFTGAIRFEQDGTIKIVYFKGGDILSASTNDRKDAIDEILLRAGKISREHIKQALAKRQENETLGDALFNLGFITRKELTWARRVQVIGIVRSVRAWTTGNYAIVPDYLPKREEGTLFPLQQIIVEFIVTEQERQPFERAMDGGEAIFRKGFDFAEQFPKLDLNDEAAEIAGQIDGRKSAAEIAVATGKDAFNVYKLLEALRLLGLIEKGMAKEEEVPPPAPVADVQFETAPAVEEELPTTSPQPMPRPSFEEPRIPPGETVAKKPAMPDWNSVKVSPSAAAAAAASAPAAAPAPPQRKRTVVAKTPPKRSRAPLYTIIALLVIAGAGYGGWMWWQQRTARAVTPAPQRAPRAAMTQTAPPASDTSASTTTMVPVTSDSARTTIAPTTTVAKTATAPPAPRVASTQPPTSGAATARLERSAAGSSTITNTPPSAAAPDAGRDRYDAMARQYAQTATGNFTVQFELVCQSASVAKAIAAGGASVWFVPTTYRGQACYKVFWGRFDTHDEAVRSLQLIPEGLRGSTPVVVAVPKS